MCKHFKTSVIQHHYYLRESQVETFNVFSLTYLNLVKEGKCL